MNLIEDGVRGFFSLFMGAVKRRIDKWWEKETGEKLPILEFDDIGGLINAIRNGEIIGEQDVKIKNVCVSNFAPLYLCYEETFGEIERTIRLEAAKAAKLYNSLRERYELSNSISLFTEAAKGKIEIDSMFREYADAKKFRFLGLSLARFGPITKKLCYGALFKAGEELKNHTAPLTDDVNLEPFVPIFYDPSISGVIQSTSYIDAEVMGRVFPLPTNWMEILRRRGVQVFQRPYCLYVPDKESYHIKKTGLETWMSLDAWISFTLPEKNLNLPFFHRFEPTDDISRQMVCNGFEEIYDQLNALSPTVITFYSDYVEPFVKKVKPVLDMKTLRRLVS